MVFLFVILTGLMAGILSGLLGLGGGVVIVPCLKALFAWREFPPESQMQLAIGTSLATMVMTTGAVSYTHYKRRTIQWPFLKSLFPGTMIGAIGGVLIAKILSSSFLQTLFGLFCIALSFYMFLRKEVQQTDKVLHPPLMLLFILALGIGILSSLLGIGGGILFIPLLLRLGLDLRQAMATSVSCAFLTTIAAALMAVIAGWKSPHLPPYTLGYVYWPLVLLLGPISMIGAPIGVKLVNYLPMKMTSWIFGAMLLFVGFKMAIAN
jgi:uncharacterized protein